jgi:uncharacterized protein involved in exopolysaccharide biosynthesis
METLQPPRGVPNPDYRPGGSTGSSSSAAEFLLLLFRRARLIGGLALGGALALGIWTMTKPRMYTSRASFTPDRPAQSPGGVAGLAASFGISLGASSTTESPQFYAELLESSEILRRVAARRFSRGPGDSVGLPTLVGVKAGSPEEAVEEALPILRRRTGIKPNPRTGVIGLEVKSESPEISRQIVVAYLESINAFNIENRNSRAAGERDFAQRQLAQYQKELAAAEDAYDAFLRTNRSCCASPDLQRQQSKLQRNIGMAQQVVTTLATAYEQARIDEVRSTPSIRVIERPRAPVVPDARGTLKNALYGGVAGLAIALAIVFLDVRRFLTSVKDSEA